MYKHIIFDLDGTIADTLPSITDSVNITLKHFKKDFSYTVKDVYNFVGYGTPYLLRKAFKQEDIPLDEILKIYLPTQLEVHLKKAVIYPTLHEALSTLKKLGYRLYIATNKPIEVGPKTIEKLYGKDFFIDAIYQTKNSPKKPDPYVVNEIIKRNNLNKNECLYVGDGEVDILTAKNASIDACLVKYGYGQYGKFDEKTAKYVINKPRELLDILK